MTARISLSSLPRRDGFESSNPLYRLPGASEPLIRCYPISKVKGHFAVYSIRKGVMKITYCRNGESYIGLSELVTWHSMTQDEKINFVASLKDFLGKCDSDTDEVSAIIFSKF